jgi:thiol peroxidase
MTASLVPLALTAACATPESFPVAEGTVQPGSSITWLGEPTRLSPASAFKVGAPFPTVTLTDLKMKPFVLAADGKVRLISVVPSLDTPVCDVQTHKLSETPELDSRVERITVSMDLPYAQRRFVEAARLENITYLSDYREQSFGHATGLILERNGLLARALIVIDRKGVVRHLQIVPEILTLPDLTVAFKKANEFARTAH